MPKVMRNQIIESGFELETVLTLASELWDCLTIELLLDQADNLHITFVKKQHNLPPVTIAG